MIGPSPPATAAVSFRESLVDVVKSACAARRYELAARKQPLDCSADGPAGCRTVHADARPRSRHRAIELRQGRGGESQHSPRGRLRGDSRLSRRPRLRRRASSRSLQRRRLTDVRAVHERQYAAARRTRAVVETCPSSGSSASSSYARDSTSPSRPSASRYGRVPTCTSSSSECGISLAKAETVEHEQELHRIAAEAGLAARVHWWARETTCRAFCGLTLLVHTPRQEPLGRVLLEAAASGVPIAASDVGGTREIFSGEAEDGAVLVPPDSTSRRRPPPLTGFSPTTPCARKCR